GGSVDIAITDTPSSGASPLPHFFCGKFQESGNSPLPLYWRHAEIACRFSGIVAGNRLASP
ncbi:hypothetical protein, partial [Pseudomonas fluorescens group sp.]